VTRVVSASRSVEEGAGEDVDEERRAGRPDEPPDRPYVETREPKDVQVEPGGETEAERNGCATLESADTEIDGRVVGTCRDVQVEVESARMRVRGSATAYARSTTAVDEKGQRSEMDVEDAPEDPPESPPPMPDEPPRPQNEPPSVELEGERRDVASCDVERTGGEADASGVSEGAEDDRERPTKPRNASERADEPLEHRSREDSPGTAPDEPDEPGGETAVPGDAHSTQEGPRCKANGGGGETSASVETPGQEVVGASRPSRVPREFGTAIRLSTAPNSMG
jgi:hypothetical protein